MVRNAGGVVCNSLGCKPQDVHPVIEPRRGGTNRNVLRHAKAPCRPSRARNIFLLADLGFAPQAITYRPSRAQYQGSRYHRDSPDNLIFENVSFVKHDFMQPKKLQVLILERNLFVMSNLVIDVLDQFRQLRMAKRKHTKSTLPFEPRFTLIVLIDPSGRICLD